MNNVPVAAHVDVSALAGGALVPVNIIAHFRVEAFLDNNQQTRRRLFLAGYGPVTTTNIIKVGFCLSECQLCKEYSQIDAGYVVSAISLVKFGRQKRLHD